MNPQSVDIFTGVENGSNLTRIECNEVWLGAQKFQKIKV